MPQIGVSILTLAVIFVVGGIPFAWAVRRRTEGWIALVIDSALFGAVTVTLAITAWTWLGVGGIVVTALLYLAAIAWLVVTKPGLPARPARLSPASWGLVAAWVALFALAIALRWHDVNFLPWVGDMGAYVNWANEFVRTGELNAGWPPVFPVFLSICSFLFGSAGTTSGMAISGILLLAVIARILGQLGVNRWIVFGVVGALAVNVHAIWFATFPGSESLNAPFFIAWLSVFVTVLRTEGRDRVAPLAVAFLVMLNLCLLRGSGMFLLAPLLVLAICVLVISGWRRWAVATWAFATVSVLAAAVSIWYGVTEIRPYFVTMQLGYLIPDRLFDWAESTGVLNPTPVLAGVLVFGVAVFAAVTWFARRLRQPTEPGASLKATRVLALVGAGILLLAVIAEAAVGANVWHILVRTGLWVVAAAILALVLLAYRKQLDDLLPLSFLATATVLVLTAFHTNRLGNDRIHAFFLYWDRYLFSEIIPALFVLAGVGIALLAGILAQRTPRLSSFAVRLPAVIAIVAIAAAALLQLPRLILIGQDSYMRGAYDFTVRLTDYTEPDDVVLWGATSPDAAPGFFFPNTWMAFAVPMNRTFGYHFENVHQGQDNFAPDDVVTAGELEDSIAANGPVVVYETQTGAGVPLDARLEGSGLQVESLGTEVSDISVLEQTPDLKGWTHVEIEVRVWRVSAG